MQRDAIQQQFTTALGALVERLKEDRSLIAAILCGSLSHDVVWEKSDIDLVIVTIDEKTTGPKHLALNQDRVNIHAFLMTRTDLRRSIEGSVRQSFSHSLLASGRLLYTHDPSVADLFATLSAIGARDRQVQLLGAATGMLPALYKAHKWLTTRGDLEYTALWILYAATALARVEVIGAGQLAGREVIPQAQALNPELFDMVYTRLLNESKTRPRVQAALDAIDAYLVRHTAAIFAPIVTHLREVGEVRSSTEIEDHFTRHFGIEQVITACEYLADRGLIGKASTAVRVTRRSTIDVQELAFFYTQELPHG